MMTDRDELFEKALKGRLTSAEAAEWQEFLRSNPAIASRFAEEKALNGLIGQLPDVPLSSNFTARTVQAALRNINPAPASRSVPGWALWIRYALGGAVACLAGVFIFHQQQVHQRKEMAESIRSVSEVANLPAQTAGNEGPPMEVWQNFDAIYRLSQMPKPEEIDTVLLVALEK